LLFELLAFLLHFLWNCSFKQFQFFLFTVFNWFTSVLFSQHSFLYWY
jgi:RsiW-degrading membrane proteinase PrsW (M82 family)